MYNPQNDIERKVIEAYLEAVVYGRRFATGTPGYEQSIERGREREWNKFGQLRAILDINPDMAHNDQHPFPNLMDGGAYEIWLSVDINEENFIGGVKVSWEMPENEWSAIGEMQSNTWPSRPYLKKPEKTS